MKQELNINEDFTYMNEKEGRITSLFALTEQRSDEIEKIVADLSELANQEHRANCKNDDHCRGVAPYLLKHVKVYFIAHGELTEFDRLGIMSAVSYSIGLHNSHDMKSNDDIPDNIIDMAMEAGFPSFEEFSKRMDKLRSDESSGKSGKKTFQERIDELMKKRE